MITKNWFDSSFFILGISLVLLTNKIIYEVTISTLVRVVICYHDTPLHCAFSGTQETRTQIICWRSLILEWRLLLTSDSSMSCSRNLVSHFNGKTMTKPDWEHLNILIFPSTKLIYIFHMTFPNHLGRGNCCLLGEGAK